MSVLQANLDGVVLDARRLTRLIRNLTVVLGSLKSNLLVA